MNFYMFKVDLDKAEEPEIKLLTSVGKTHGKNRLVPNWERSTPRL